MKSVLSVDVAKGKSISCWENGNKKGFNAMLKNNKYMPKYVKITDEVMRKVPFGKVITVGAIRDYFAKKNNAVFIELQKKMLEKEGHTIIQKGRTNIRYYVKDYEKSLIEL